MTKEERDEMLIELRTLVEHKPFALTHEESQWVRLAIQRELQMQKVRQAVIEKTLSALLWSMLVAVGWAILEMLKTHFHR